MMQNIFAVFFGGGIGALTRFLIFSTFPRGSYLPIQTMLVNFWGCFLAVIIVTFIAEKSISSTLLRNLLITGFCGGLSTFSTISLEVMEYLQNGDYTKTIIYLIINLFICIISVILGVVLVKKYV